MGSWSSSSLNLTLLDRFHLNFMFYVFFFCFFVFVFFNSLFRCVYILKKMIIFYLFEKRRNKNIKNSLSTLLPHRYQKSNSFNYYLIINYYHNNHLMLQSCPQCVFAFLISCACVSLHVVLSFFVDFYFSMF